VQCSVVHAASACGSVCPNEAGVSHQAGHAVLTDAPAVESELSEHAWRSIGGSRRDMNVIDRVRQPRIGEFALRDPRPFPAVVAGSGDADQLTESLHLEEVAVVVNEPAATHLVVSFAKDTAARFSTSRSCFSSAFSLRSRLHFELLRAFTDDPVLDRIHRTATQQHYRTHEFGDSLLIERRSAA
jgi:hypothetical protein